MDDIYNKGRNQHTIEGVLKDPPDRIVQPQPVSYETMPISDDDIQSSLLSKDHVQSSFMPDDHAEGSSIIPGGAETFIKARSDSSPAQPRQNSSRKLRTEQAYRLLAVAIIAVLIASSVLAAFIATGGMSANALHHANQPLAKAHATPAARSTQGHPTASKQTPAAGPTQANPPATPQPTQSSPTSGGNPPPATPTSSGPLALQFVNLPHQVVNGATVPITVQTQPGTIVYFGIYACDIGNNCGTIYPRLTADNNGLATYQWLDATNIGGGTADITVTAVDNKNHQVHIQATVAIVDQ